jgi:hypothetical protein
VLGRPLPNMLTTSRSRRPAAQAPEAGRMTANKAVLIGHAEGRGFESLQPLFSLQISAFHQDYESLDGALFDRVLGTQRPNHMRLLRRFLGTGAKNRRLRGSASMSRERFRPTQ